MGQLHTIVKDGDYYGTQGAGGRPVDDGAAYTPPANSLMILTVGFYGAGSAMTGAAETTLTNDGWTPLAGYVPLQNSNIPSNVYWKLVGGSPTAITGTLNNGEEATGLAWNISLFTGDVSGVELRAHQNSGNPGAYDVFTVNTSAYQNALNSTYGIVIGDGSGKDAGFPGLTYVPHVYNPSSGSSNQHFFAADTAIVDPIYTEDVAAINPTVTLIEILGNTPPIVLPILSASGSAGVSIAGATITASSDTFTGTVYVVVGAATDIDAITEDQLVLGQNDQDLAALMAGSQVMSDGDISIAMLATLEAATIYSYAMFQRDGSDDSVILKGTFATVGVLNHGFSLVLSVSPGVPSGDETGLTAKLFSDRGHTTQIGIAVTTAAIVSGKCDMANSAFGITPALGSTSFIRLYRPTPATKADNVDHNFEVICIDLDTADNSYDGVS
ncbi:MAG: hypothetical protein JKY93_01775 [Gammaproteobacteria bacterium]|nr:hypothetical protein [Gammaproteobacteria bacterium]